MVELDVKKMVDNKPNLKRLELEYDDMNYIIINFIESVIDVDGQIWEYKADENLIKEISKLVWEYEDFDEFDYWPDKTKDHAPMSPLWRLSFYDEFDTYYHKSGATGYPEMFMELVNKLKGLEKR